MANHTDVITIPNHLAHDISPSVRDDHTGAFYVHKDYDLVLGDWEFEDHIATQAGTIALGDIGSWVAYVQRFGMELNTICTWNHSGLFATLDYHSSYDDVESIPSLPGRCQWNARYGFCTSRQVTRWLRATEQSSISQLALVDLLEEMRSTIVEPNSAEIITLLRSLSASVNKRATSEFDDAGHAYIEFSQTKEVHSNNSDTRTAIPTEITILVPILAGVAEYWRLHLRLRTWATTDGSVSFKLSAVDYDDVLDQVIAEQIETVRVLLGDGYSFLRTAD